MSDASSTKPTPVLPSPLPDPNPAKIVTAGAGSGKTYRITEEVLAFVKQGVAIERIGAVTFTEKAAAELQERIRKGLIEAGELAAAQRVDAAPIRTIHAFALSILQENPFDAGMSPQPLVLGEIEAGTLMARVIAEVMEAPGIADPVEFLTTSYLHDESTPPFKSAADQLSDTLLKLCELIRSLRLHPRDRDRMIDANAAEIRATFGPPGDGAALDAELQAEAQPAIQFVADYPDGKTGGDRKVIDKLRDVVDAIRSRNFDLDTLALANTKWSNAGVAFLAAAQPLTVAVDRWMRSHPRVLAHLERVAADLFTVAFEVLGRYQESKARLGALDYEDMQARACELLEQQVNGRPFAEYVAAGITHLVVDEFQDTSPLQFRIIETLREHGTRCVYVGDPKQGIYAFRGADSRLLIALESVQRQRDPCGVPDVLPHSWRSRPELVSFVNAVFGPVFEGIGLPYFPLTPAGVYGTQKEPDGPVKLRVPKAFPSIDVLEARRNGPSLLGRIDQILADPTFEVYDRKAERMRPIRPGDIAILCHGNSALDTWARKLQETGHRYARELDGWCDSLEIQVTRAALMAIAHPSGSLDLAALLVSEVYGITQAQLKQLRDAEFFRGARRMLAPDSQSVTDFLAELGIATGPLREALERFAGDFRFLTRELRHRTLPDFVQALIERLELERVFMAKGQGPQAKANLLRMCELARSFASLDGRSLEMLGATSLSLENFLFYLDAVVRTCADGQPEPIPEDDDAIKLVTMHRAKGLEWPVVVLPDLQKDISPRLPRYESVRPEAPEALISGRFFDLARIRVFPGAPSATLSEDLANGAGGGEAARAERARLLYVAFTRAREHLVLGWKPQADPGTYQSLLEESGLALDLASATFRVGKHAWPVTSCASPAPSAVLAQTPEDRQALRAALFDGQPLGDGSALPFYAPPAMPRFVETSPTELCHFADSREQWRIWRRGGEPDYPISGREAAITVAALTSGRLDRSGIKADASDVGTLVHLALERGNVGFGGLADDALLAALERRFACVEGGAKLAAIGVAAVQNIRTLVAQLGACGVARELPFILPLGEHVLTGSIDLAIETPGGWHALDHKVHPLPDGALARWAAFYEPQLEAYALAIGRLTGRPILGRHLAFHVAGKLVTLGPCGVQLEPLLGEMAMLDS